MQRVVIVESFTLTHDDGKLQRFNPGIYELDDHIATHWYVVAHSDRPGPYEPKVGTPEYAKEAARKAARRRLIDAAIEDSVESELADIDAQAHEQRRRTIVKEATKPTPGRKSLHT
jgi:hypothetical protein